MHGLDVWLSITILPRKRPGRKVLVSNVPTIVTIGGYIICTCIVLNNICINSILNMLYFTGVILMKQIAILIYEQVHRKKRIPALLKTHITDAGSTTHNTTLNCVE